MSETSRYDKFKNLIRNDFSRSRTLTPGLSANEQRTLFNLNDHNDSYAIPERFEKFGPFNAIYVKNFSNRDIRVYLNEQRTTFVDVEGNTNQGIAVAEKIPIRYVDYLRIENLSGNAISEGDVQLQIGNEVDGVELRLLEMSGLLNV
jgi:hypothetical protein